MKRYLIYTEDKGNLESIAGAYLPNCTITKGIGIWEGGVKSCVIIEAIGNEGKVIIACAKEIKRVNKQDAVMVTQETVDMVLI